MLALAASLVLLAAPAQGAPAEASSSTTMPLTLENYLARFFAVDPAVATARLEAELAANQAARAVDQLRITARGSAPLAYELYALPSLPPLHLGTAELPGAGVEVSDPLGGTLSSQVSGRLTTDPKLKAGGQLAGARVSYSLPLWRNALGRLYRLEQAAFLEERAARGAEADALALARCAAAIDVYTQAWALDEQLAVWTELLEHKERIYDRTRRDYAKRLVSRLDRLTAQSDWVAARGRHAAFQADRERALAVIATYVSADRPVALASPEAALQDALPSSAPLDLEERVARHPDVLALEHALDALGARTVLADAQMLPEVALVPGVGVDYLSHAAATTPGAIGSGALPLFAGVASVGVSVEWPVLAPSRDYQVRALSLRRAQVERRLAEQRRALVERARLAAEVVEAADLRLVLNEEKLDTIQKQISEATGLYQQGRLEFQDFLQHWAFLEEARFERLQLVSQRFAAQTDLMRAVGQLPPACAQGG